MKGCIYKFKFYKIKNFRNYKNIELDLTNKNIILERNDFDKTNFMHALRLMFDSKVRNKGVEQSNYHNKNVSKSILTLLGLDISEEDNDNNNFIRAMVCWEYRIFRGKFLY